MRSHRTTECWRGGPVLVLALLCLATPTPVPAQEEVTYADLAPLLDRRCAPCHSGPVAARGLQLDSYAGVLTGSARGAVVKAGDPDASEMVRRLTGTGLPRMPLTGPPYLDASEVERVRRWIAAGLPEGAPRPPGRGSQASAPASAPKPLGTPVTWSDVAPLLATRCAKCHTDDGLLGAPPEGYRLTTHAAALTPAERARVVPGQSWPRMPYDGPPYLNAAEMALIEAWIAQGARDGEGRAAAVPEGARVRLQGTLAAGWQLDGLPLRVSGSTRLDKDPGPGDRVEVRGRVTADGGVAAERIRRR